MEIGGNHSEADRQENPNKLMIMRVSTRIFVQVQDDVHLMHVMMLHDDVLYEDDDMMMPRT